MLLLAAKFGVPVCPHAGGVGLCEYVQHLAIFDYIARQRLARGPRASSTSTTCTSTSVDPAVVRDGRYVRAAPRPATASRCCPRRSTSTSSRRARPGRASSSRWAADDASAPSSNRDARAAGRDRSGSIATGCCRSALCSLRAGPALILLLLIVVVSLTTPIFFTSRNIGNVFSQTSVIAVLALGQLLVIVTRGIDLSVGSTIALSGVVGAIVFEHTQLERARDRRDPRHRPRGRRSSTASIFVYGRVPHPFIVTLATLSIVRGLALWACERHARSRACRRSCRRSAAARSTGSRTRSSSSSALALLLPAC